MAVSSSSPIKPLRPNHAAHSRLEVQTFVVPEYEQEITREQFWAELNYNPEDFRECKFSDGYCPSPKGDFKEYMERISEDVRGRFRLVPDHLIKFHETAATPPVDHPTGTRCKPDFSACSNAGEKIHWTEIDATVEIHSAGTNATEGPRHAASYTLYLLQARPDRVSVQGFYVDEKGVILIISSAEGVKKSPRLKLSETSDVRLMHAFVQRLYDPHPSMLDPTTSRRKDPVEDRWVFDINLTIPDSPSVECTGYRILNVRESVGQRTHLFVNNDNPTHLSDGVPIRVIKDQYRFPDHRFGEAEVIRHIHQDEDIPGVVRIAHSEAVLHSDHSPVCSGDRNKSRICLLEYGKPFMDLKTPLEALIAIYDLLETTRFMYTRCKVLHRDISCGNLMYIEKDCPVTSSPPADADKNNGGPHYPKFCSIKHLLDPRVKPSATSNLLIDLDRGEILSIKQDERRLEQMGTPTFMARAVRAGKPLGRVGDWLLFERMPELSTVAHGAYKQVFPDRLTRFQHSKDWHIAVIKASAGPSSWRHELRHDAESAFWLLVWWAVNASPEDGMETEMPYVIWALFAGTQVDMRPCSLPSAALHPAYSYLGDVLRQLGNAVLHDFHWATEMPYTDPEFLHEAFQRHILNFIFAHRDADFMNLPKADSLRKPRQITQSPSLSTSQINAFRATSGSKRSRDPEPESNKVKKLKLHT